MKTPFGSLGGGCRENEKGFLHYCVLMGQKTVCHLWSLASCRKAVLYSCPPPPPPSCPLQPENHSLPFLTLAANYCPSSTRSWGDPTLNHCQSWGDQNCSTTVLDPTSQIPALATPMVDEAKPGKKLGVNSYQPERPSCSFHLLVGWTLP